MCVCVFVCPTDNEHDLFCQEKKPKSRIFNYLGSTFDVHGKAAADHVIIPAGPQLRGQVMLRSGAPGSFLLMC